MAEIYLAFCGRTYSLLLDLKAHCRSHHEVDCPYTGLLRSAVVYFYAFARRSQMAMGEPTFWMNGLVSTGLT